MFRTIGLALAATAITFATPATTAIAGGDSRPPGSAFLSPAAAEAALGSWGLQDWKRVNSVPSRLHFDDSCAPGLHPDRTVRVLRDRDDPHPATASIRSAIKQYGTVSAAKRVKLDRRDRLHDCVNDLPGHDQLLNGMRVTSPSGTARVFGGALGSRGGSRQLEYVVVARDGAAVELMTLHIYAQDTPFRAAIRDLTERLLHRLHRAA
ncbi:MAG: hypothetical protein ACRDPQ_07410 [Nocardioidaceae bacterium]